MKRPVAKAVVLQLACALGCWLHVGVALCIHTMLLAGGGRGSQEAYHTYVN
jgi:hypothetical protein